MDVNVKVIIILSLSTTLVVIIIGNHFYSVNILVVADIHFTTFMVAVGKKLTVKIIANE